MRPGSRFPRPVSLAAAATVAALTASCAALPAADSSPERPHPPAGTGSSAATADRPNILMVTADDASINDLKYMPITRRLIAERGVTATNMVAPTPVCVPARATLLTGQYAHNHGALTVGGPRGGRPWVTRTREEEMLPSWLQDAGYDTLFVGKYLNGYGEDGNWEPPAGWTDWRGSMGKATYRYDRIKLYVNDHVVRKAQYSSDAFSQITTRLLGQPRRQRKPWFLWVNYVAPHAGGPAEPDDPKVVYPDDKDAFGTASPAPRHAGTFENLRLPRVPSMFEADVSDKWSQTAQIPRWTRARRAQIREAHQQRVESLQAVDEAMGRAIRKLRRTGQLARTVVMYSSDNGFLVGEHRRAGKRFAYHESLTVPLVIRGPGVPRGKTLRTPISHADLAATVVGRADAEPTFALDGRDIWGLWRTPTRNRVIPIEAYRKHAPHLTFRGVRTLRYTYAVYRNGDVELFDHRRDPYELVNVAGDPAYAKVAARLAAQTRRYARCAGASCPN